MLLHNSTVHSIATALVLAAIGACPVSNAYEFSDNDDFYATPGKPKPPRTFTLSTYELMSDWDQIQITYYEDPKNHKKPVVQCLKSGSTISTSFPGDPDQTIHFEYWDFVGEKPDVHLECLCGITVKMSEFLPQTAALKFIGKNENYTSMEIQQYTKNFKLYVTTIPGNCQAPACWPKKPNTCPNY